MFTHGSQVGKRALAYGQHFDEYQQIVFALKKHNLQPVELANNTWAYPTNSVSRLFYIFDAIKLGSKLLKQNQADWVISAQDPFETGLVVCWLAWWHKIPFQIQIHTDFLSPYFARQSWLNRIRVCLAKLILPRADGVRVVSERIKNSIAKTGIKTKIEPVVLPIVINQASSQSICKNLKEQYSQFSKLVLVVSRLEPEKNIALAIKTFGTIVAKFPKAGLIIVGAGSEKSRLESLVKRLGLVKQVVFVGQQNNLTTYYQSADILLNTSNYEGYGLVLAEARLADLSVISTDVGIARELIGSESVCPVGAKSCLAQKVELGLSGQIKQLLVPTNLIETDFNQYVEKYVNLLRQCLNQ